MHYRLVLLAIFLNLLLCLNGQAAFLYVSMWGEVLSFDVSRNSKEEIEASRRLFVDTKPWGGGGRGLAFDTHGNLFVANPNNNSISKFNGAGVFQQSIVGTTELLTPYDLTIDRSNNLYVANVSQNSVSKFDSQGVFQYSLNSYLPTGVAVDSMDNLYVSSDNLTTISKFDSNGALIDSFGTAIRNHQLAFDAEGNLFASNGWSESVIAVKYSADGGVISEFNDFNTTWRGAAGLAIGAGGNLFLANYIRGTISKYSPNGEFMFDFSVSTGSNGGPMGLAFGAAVPEPSSLSITFALVAAFVFRRDYRLSTKNS
jgi:sugar lactone lactonase YvrE